ncbi:MAG: NAD-dependent epimerase/dehydratase family protein [Candidatus Aminicenantes bacterium]|nr:NAD-dependent epimerase/dehydratase family protein [Candidatus Aminicenantes bacterium]
MAKETKRVLMTGAAGQIGSELAQALRAKYGRDNVLVTDVVRPPAVLAESGPFELVDVTNRSALDGLIGKFGADTVYHLAALLSATGEKNPQKAWDVNMNGLYNILEIGRARGLVRIFSPSSIAVFGPSTPRERTPQDTVLGPSTMYGVTKVAGELLADYYVRKYGLDVRGCRYPGIISHLTLPGGGTTDYAVAIYYEAVKHGRYTCFLREDTRLPMMYMPDCLKCTLDLMDADFARLSYHAGFNVTAMSFSAGELAAEIRKHVPGFEVRYEPDFRQAIADSWPASIDDSAARAEWDWKPDYDLAAMTVDMLAALRARYAAGTLGV